MAKVVVTDDQDWVKITEMCGGDRKLIMYDPPTSELEVPDVTQAALDTALADYIVNQVSIDAATDAADVTAEKNLQKIRLSEPAFNALIEGIVSEINLLRDEHNLSNRTVAQVKTFIEGKIDAG
jgi:hypothetical protein